MQDKGHVDIKHIELPLTPMQELEDLSIELGYLSQYENGFDADEYAECELYCVLKIERLKKELGLNMDEIRISMVMDEQNHDDDSSVLMDTHTLIRRCI